MITSITAKNLGNGVLDVEIERDGYIQELSFQSWEECFKWCAEVAK